MNAIPAIRILRTLSDTPTPFDQITAEGDVTSLIAHCELGILELDGLATATIDGWLRDHPTPASV